MPAVPRATIAGPDIPRSSAGGRSARWRIWIDTGGTFTDCVAVGPDGSSHRAKVLSSSALRGTIKAPSAADSLSLRVRESWGAPSRLVCGFRFRLLGREHRELRVMAYDAGSGVLQLDGALDLAVRGGESFELHSPEESAILAARLVTRTPAGPLPPLDLRIATTRGTNALLERRGAPTVLFVTRGFGDLLRIGTQQRPDLFVLDIRRPEPLPFATVEVPERVTADDQVLQRIDLDALLAPIATLRAAGVESAAVALLHGFRNPEHERELEALLLRSGFRHVSRSSAVAPSIKIFPRAQTTTVDAYLAPVISSYLAAVCGPLTHSAHPRELSSTVHVMTSAGGLLPPDGFRAKDSLLSGPAGGVAGAALAGRRSGFDKIIAFDMGGTSTDVSRVDGDFDYVWEHRVGDAQIVAPALGIESVAAGGGSVCGIDANGLYVGPHSAGAWPGPACYGAGGPLTLTDVNLLLGRLDPARFGIPIDSAPAAVRADALCAELRERTEENVAREPLLEGLLAIANERMADAIRTVSLRRGYDPAEYTLVAFGGAGAQHACGVAERLGIGTVLVPADAGLLSALGLGHAVRERIAARQVLAPLDHIADRVPKWIEELTTRAFAALEGDGVAPDERVVRRRIVNLRYIGQESTLEVEHDPALPLRDAFEQRYVEVYGHRPPDRTVELESLRVIAASASQGVAAPPPAIPFPAVPDGVVEVWWRSGDRPATRAGALTSTSWFERSHLAPGAWLEGPALIREAHSTTVVAPGWCAEVDGAGALILHRSPAEPAADSVAVAVSAVREELFTHRFEALVTEMGEQLRRTALSTNIRERLDFSCALLDPGGELIVNAPHIPVHLGALGLCVRSVRAALPLELGDVVVTNHPAFGGSHLPDVTVVSPVHTADGELLGYVASRAHHAELGGTRPGSMPPAATTLAEEGVVIPPTYLVRAGEGNWEAVERLLREAPHPSRAPADNLADLRAQLAANHRGALLLHGLAEEHGAGELRVQMRALADRAERRIRQALTQLPDGTSRAEQRLDDGSLLRVALHVAGDRATLDFAGSAGTHLGNLNATPAIVRSAVLYVLRLLIDEPLPLNEGLMRAVELRIPPGILHPHFPAEPAHAPAVVGGNTETSQRLVDTLLAALRLAACSQGTMNNVLWGNENFGYYETVCGGAGAGPGFHGADAVHTHMTNTRITDPEILEARYPVRVERFAIRRGSGGEGEWRGGDGVVREIRFLAPMSVSVLSQHRVERPYGMAGGSPGAPGRQWVLRADGRREDLGSVDGCEVAPGDRLVLETPGGGGWGPAAATGSDLPTRSDPLGHGSRIRQAGRVSPESGFPEQA